VVSKPASSGPERGERFHLIPSGQISSRPKTRVFTPNGGEKYGKSPKISGKSGLVKYNNLARYLGRRKLLAAPDVRHMTCGISSGADGGSQVTCGVPMCAEKGLEGAKRPYIYRINM